MGDVSHKDGGVDATATALPLKNQDSENRLGCGHGAAGTDKQGASMLSVDAELEVWMGFSDAFAGIQINSRNARAPKTHRGCGKPYSA